MHQGAPELLIVIRRDAGRQSSPGRDGAARLARVQCAHYVEPADAHHIIYRCMQFFFAIPRLV